MGPAAQHGSSPDSPLEEAGFEPLVPRDTTKFSTPAHYFCLTPCTRKSRRERQPTPRGCRAPPAEPMVRILFPPAGSLRTLGPRRDGDEHWTRETGLEECVDKGEGRSAS